MTFAYFFAAGPAVEAFVAAMRFPNLLRDLLAENALSASATPVLAEVEEKRGGEAARRLAGRILGALLFFGGAATVLGIALAPWYVPATVPGFADRPEVVARTISLTRILFPFLLLVSLTAFAQALANLRGRFFRPGLAPALANAGLVAAPFLAFAAGLRPSIEAPAAGFLVGAAAGAILAGSAVGVRIRPARPWGARDEEERAALLRVLALAAPVALGIGTVQVVSFLSNQVVASFAGKGAMAYLAYAYRVMHLPLGLVAVPLGSALLPALSRAAAAGEAGRVDFLREAGRGLRLAVALGGLAGVYLFFFGADVVGLLFEHGRFGPKETAATAEVLAAYALGLPSFAANRVLAPSLYALQKARRATAFAVASVFASLAASAAGVAMGGGAPAVALGTTLGGWLHTSLLAGHLVRSGRLRLLALLEGLSLVFLGAAIAALCARTFGPLLPLEAGIFFRLARLAAGCVAFLPLSWFFVRRP